MNVLIPEIKENLIHDLQSIFGESLDKIILYGSSARNEETPESDIDVMVLLNMNDENVRKYEGQIDALSVGYDLKYMIVLSIILVCKDEFNGYKNLIPLYNNVVKEGIPLYGG